MGFFTKIKNKANSALGLGKNNDLLRIGAGVMTGGASELAYRSEQKGGLSGSISDLLLGKKADDINPDAIADQIRATQSKGLGELNSALDTPADQIVREQVNREKAGVLSSAQDARRNAQRMMAQRGLAGTSLGLNLNRSIDQDTTKSLATIDARVPGAIRDQKLKDAMTRISAGGINQNGINFNTIEGQRSGGLLGYASQLAPMAGSIGQLMNANASMNLANAYAANNKPQQPKPYVSLMERG